MSDTTEIELIGTALQNFDRVSAGLALLEKNYKGVLYEVDTSLGMAHAKAARAAIREPRYEVERLRKDAKAPLLSLGKRLDAEATRITNALLTLEEPIHQQIKSEEDRIEQEKLAKAAAEAARVAHIQRLIDGIRNWPVIAADKHSSLVAKQLANATDYVIDPTVFEERTEEAQGVLEASRVALSGIHAGRLAHEAEQERIKAERIELNRLRAEQAERDRVAREALAKQEAEARAVRDADNARQAEILRQERAENDRIARKRQAELDRQAQEQRTAQAAEQARIAAERAELERQQEALRKANEPKPKTRGIKNPGREAIIERLADGFCVEKNVARRWLREIDWEQEAA